MTQEASYLGSTPKRLLLIIFLVCFLVYQTTLAVTAVDPFPDFWFFGADSYRVALTNIPARNWHPMAIYQAKKRPLFIALSMPLHQLGRFVYGGMPEPLNENMPLSFPAALFGALSVCVAYLLFRKIGFREKQALLPTILYGAAAGVWIFASFPETYSCTSLFTNLFILVFLADTKLKRLRGLVFAHVLVCFAAPQQVLLGVIPLFQLIRVDGFRVGIRRAVQYGLMLGVLFVLPYLIISTVQEKEMGMSIAGATLPALSSFTLTHGVSSLFLSRKRLSCFLNRQDTPPPLRGSSTTYGYSSALRRTRSSRRIRQPGEPRKLGSNHIDLSAFIASRSRDSPSNIRAVDNPKHPLSPTVHLASHPRRFDLRR